MGASVSVIMAARNAEPFLAEAVQSILAQDFDQFELLIVDDASTDGTYALAERFAAEDSRIRVLKNDSQKGISETRNRAIQQAQGELIAIQDADDIALPHRLRLQVAHFLAYPRCAVLGGTIEIVGPTLERLGFRHYPENDRVLKRKAFFYSPVAQPAVMFRKSAFVEAGGYDPNYPSAEDLDLWFRIGRVHEIHNLPDTLTRYRVWPGSSVGKALRRVEWLSLKIRWRNRTNQAFRFDWRAGLFLAAHGLSLLFVPSRFKHWLFLRLRDLRA